MTSNIAAEKDFLFVINIKNEIFYQDQAELALFLKRLPVAIRLYAVIHSGMNTLKIYCIANNYSDYETVSDLPDVKTEILKPKKPAIIPPD